MSALSLPAFLHSRYRAFPLMCAVHVALLGATLTPLCAAETAARSSFDFGWRFLLGDPAGAQNPPYVDSSWRALDLPHDWSIEGPYDEHAATGGSGGYLPAGIGWYRKTFSVPESARDRRVAIEFDGVYQHSTVWINDHELGTRPYGYSSFVYDLTPFVTYGAAENVIAIRVDNSSQPNSRWYSGSGIYRHTWLCITDPVHVTPWGVYVTTPDISAAEATVRVRTRIKNSSTVAQPIELHTRIDGAPVISPAELAPGEESEIETLLKISAPRLWSPTSPSLYQVRSEIWKQGAAIETIETTFGVRSVVFDADRGLLLNGTPIKMKGLCLHHDGGAVGAAVPEAVLERRLRLLQEMGCNALRCSHNPMAPEFYDLCDRLGLLVMDEAFDEWTIRKPQIKFGYSDVFNEWSERDLVTLIHRDRNHPSVILWNAGNEIGEQRAPEGPAVLGRLVEIIHREDPTRPVTAAMDNIFNQSGEAPTAFTDLLDVVGYNYVDRWGSRRETQYADDRHHYPRRKFVGTENNGIRSTRGEYRFGPLLGRALTAGQPPAASGPSGALYLTDSIRPASLWRFVATHDYVSGDFIWTGFDYLGESRWPRKLATSGPLDTAGFKKDAFYFYQSVWTTTPMIHLLPHWNWPDRVGQNVPVVAYSNCSVVELFLNGRSLGAKAREFPSQGTAGGWNTYAQPTVQATTADLQFVWDVPYAPGELHAVGYDRQGHVVSETSVHTAGDAAALELSVDRETLRADARDVAHLSVRAVDARGNFVPLAQPLIHFDVSGPARLIGVDNGDPESHASYQGNERALFNGLALALVQSTRQPGSLRITARASGLREASIEIITRPSP